MEYLEKTRLRFEAKVISPNKNKCSLWAGALGPNGYGRIGFRGKVVNAHRVSWVLYRGEIPRGLCVLHRCDVRACVNPDHLFLGTVNDNNLDRELKGRGVKSRKPETSGLRAFKKWWREASPEAKKCAAKKAKTSYFHLSNLATVEGKTIGADLAGRLEVATGGAVKRGDLCEACRGCSYYRGVEK